MWAPLLLCSYHLPCLSCFGTGCNKRRWLHTLLRTKRSQMTDFLCQLIYLKTCSFEEFSGLLICLPFHGFRPDWCHPITVSHFSICLQLPIIAIRKHNWTLKTARFFIQTHFGSFNIIVCSRANLSLLILVLRLRHCSLLSEERCGNVICKFYQSFYLAG